MRKVVGISQKIKRAWLDAVLGRLVKTTDNAELRAFLDKHLKDELPGTESRAKAAGIILRIWSDITAKHIDLRDRALSLLPRISGQERVWLHWGMTALAYPFFRDIAEVIGRLLALQDDFTTAQVQGRMLTAWGDRATTKEAAQKLITSLVDWEVLRSTKTKGHFLLARKMTTSIVDLQLWLLEALLGASTTKEVEVQQFLRLPESFPFRLSISIADLRRHKAFDIHRQGIDMDMVALRKLKLPPPSRKTRKAKKTTASPDDQASLFSMESDEVISNYGGPIAVSSALVHAKVVDDQQISADDVRRVAPYIKTEDVPMLSERADRFSPFTASSARCTELFREGRYVGCIALTQSLFDAIIFRVCRIKLKKQSGPVWSFEKNLETLHRKKLIDDDWKIKLGHMWADRHSFHFLRSSVECDQRRLKEKARSLLNLLKDLDQEIWPRDVA
jgi:hypothetical protein